jgi:hypothetical protein
MLLRERPGLLRRGALLALLLAGTVLACGGDDPVTAPAPTTDGAQLYWALALDHRAITLSTVAPYDTLRLAATPRNAGGGTLPVSSSVTFTSSDPATVRVDPDGLVHAVSPGAGALVVAALQHGGVTRTDTAVVNVTAEAQPPVLAQLTLEPVPADSAKIAAFTSAPLSVVAADTAGQPIPGLAVACTSSNPLPPIAVLDPGCQFVFALHPGQLQIVASATAYGVTKVDTLRFTIGYQLVNAVTMRPRTPTLGTATIGVGGIVQWVNLTGQPVDVTFDDSTNVAEDPSCACGAGNIASFGVADTTDFVANVRRRRFPMPGTYPFRSATTQASGTIVVTGQ